MARIRTLKIGFFKSERLAEFSPWHRLLFEGLWLLADKRGILEDRPRRIKADIFPYDDVDVSALLQDLAKGDDPFITRYVVGKEGYIHVRNFLKHQRPHHTEPDSSLPTPDQAFIAVPETHGELTVNSPLSHGEKPEGKEGKGREGNEEGKGTDAGERRAPELSPADVVALERTNVSAFGNPHHKPTNLVNGAELRKHGTHAWCSWPERDGLCVTYPLHREFIGKLGAVDADVRLRAWYPAVMATYVGRPIGDDVYDFWRNEFGQWVGTVTSKPSMAPKSKAEHSIAAAQRVLARMEAK